MRRCQLVHPKPPKPPQNLTVTNITKNSATLSWLGDKGDILLNDIAIAESIASPYIIENLESNTEYAVKIVNRGGESEEVTFTTKEVTYKEVTILCDLKGKKTGSVIENPHFSGRNGVNTSLLKPDGNWVEQTQAMYTQLATLDNTVFSSVSNIASSLAQVIFKFNIIEAIERYDSNYFSNRGANTIAEKVAVLNQEIESATYNVYGFASGANSTTLTTAPFSKTQTDWGGKTNTYGTEVIRNGRTSPSTDVQYIIQPDGFVYVIAYAPASDGTTASSVSIDYANLELTILVEED